MNQAYLRECFEYRPETGQLIWKARPASHFQSVAAWKNFLKRFPGTIAGSPHGDGYWKVGLSVDGVPERLLAHRIIWCLVYGDLPEMLDHINGEKSDNRLENLREATNRLNQANRKLNKNNSTGYKGVYKHPSKKYVANIRKGGKQCHLGCFESAEDAHRAYVAAANDLHGSFARAA